MAYTNLSFCWHGILERDVDAATAFYTDLLGWQVQTNPMGTMLAVDGVRRAHVAPPPMAEVPAHWSSYLRVADVDQSAQKAVQHGGTLLVPGTDIPPGRFATVASPSGATFHLFHEADPTASDAPDGGIHWTELHSTDLDADLAWLEAAFGITSRTMAMPTGPYHILENGSGDVGGALKAMMPQAPSMWLVWARVADIDAVVARTPALGGRLYTEVMNADGIGRMAIAADPAGAAFGIIQPPTR